MIKSAAQSSLLNDTRYTSMSAGVVPSSEYLISTTVLEANTPSVTFDVSSFAGVYKHLQIVIVARSNGPFNDDAIRIRFNSDSGSNYSFHQLIGNGSSVTSSAATSQTGTFPIQIAGNASAANVFGGGVLDILDPYSSSKNTTVRGFSGITTANLVMLRSGAWLNTASITSITLNGVDGGNLLTGSRFSIYGVTA